MRSIADLHDRLGPRPGACVLAPTMGALHEGHAVLIARGAALARERRLAGGCVATIFVNPTQFDDAADFARYPRTLTDDLQLAARAGASAVFVPGVADVYPPDGSVVPPELPPVATRPGLEDACRGGHFAGVCQVVKRLFEMTRPASAVFGEKDWQQLQVVRAMAAMERLGVEVVGVETVREPDGLAMSSRNRFLDGEGRGRALSISMALCEARRGRGACEAEGIMREVLGHAGVEPEYAVVRDAATLGAPGSGPKRALVAARVGAVRLIDNAAWEPAAQGRPT
ncbi:MAG: 4-phosphopantoate--beta-alanine ligase [Phycisphaerae bacterium]|nr:4-phosphopantoate--beta-alanine ligase [Phycisphaerae bacterium]